MAFTYYGPREARAVDPLGSLQVSYNYIDARSEEQYTTERHAASQTAWGRDVSYDLTYKTLNSQIVSSLWTDLYKTMASTRNSGFSFYYVTNSETDMDSQASRSTSGIEFTSYNNFYSWRVEYIAGGYYSQTYTYSDSQSRNYNDALGITDSNGNMDGRTNQGSSSYSGAFTSNVNLSGQTERTERTTFFSALDFDTENNPDLGRAIDNRTTQSGFTSSATQWIYSYDINGTSWTSSYASGYTNKVKISDVTNYGDTINDDTTYETEYGNTVGNQQTVNNGVIPAVGPRYARGYGSYSQYPSSTSSAIQSSIYNSNVNGTRSFIGYSTSNVTFSDASAITTLTHSYTVASSALIGSSNFRTTTVTSSNVSYTSWNGSTTVSTVVSTTQTRSSNILPTNFTVTAGQTFLLYAKPEVLFLSRYTQKYTVIADTGNREIFWSPNGNDVANSFVAWSDGVTLSSYSMSDYETFYSSKRPGITQVVSIGTYDGEIIYTEEEVTYSKTTNNGSATITTTSQFAASIYPDSTVTILSANAISVNSISVGTRTAAVSSNQRTNTFSFTSFESSQGTFTLQSPGYVLTTSNFSIPETISGSGLVFDGATFTTTTFQSTILGKKTFETSTTVDYNDVSGSTSTQTNDEYGATNIVQTKRSWTKGTSSNVTSFYLPNIAIGFSGPNQVTRQSFSYLGLFGQNPNGSLGATNAIQTNIGNNGSTIFYPFKAYVDGSNIVTPLVYPVRTTTNFGLTSYSYQYSDGSLLATTANATTTSSFNYSFGQTPTTSSYVMSPRTTQNFTLSSSILVGNNEIWPQDSIMFTVGPGAFVISKEMSNTIATSSFFNPSGFFSQGEDKKQYGFGATLVGTNLLASATTYQSTSSLVTSAKANYAATTYALLTS